MLVSPNPLPYSSVRVWEANSMTCLPYCARSFPFCSCVTICQPISQLRTTNRWSALRRLADVLPRLKASSQRQRFSLIESAFLLCLLMQIFPYYSILFIICGTPPHILQFFWCTIVIVNSLYIFVPILQLFNGFLNLY